MFSLQQIRFLVKSTRHKQTFQIPHGVSTKTGFQILPDGDVLFVDRYNKCLILFNDAGEFVRTVVTTKSELNDVCYLTENKVAVTDTNRVFS